MGMLSKWSKKKEKEQLALNESSVEKETVKTEVKSTMKEQNEVAVIASMRHVIVRPLVSEKSLTAEGKGVYTFVVLKDASKVEVKKAVKDLYGVLPSKVRMIGMGGKKVRFGRFEGTRNNWKKAIVTVPAGQSLSIHEGV